MQEVNENYFYHKQTGKLSVRMILFKNIYIVNRLYVIHLAGMLQIVSVTFYSMEGSFGREYYNKM